MDIFLANPRGFCAGVDRAIDIVGRALELYGAPVYVRHEVVHNRFVVDKLRSQGAVFVEELDEVPDGALVIFSAHGVSRKVEDEAARRGLRVFDATCPLVTKVHMEVGVYARDGYDVVLIGHQGHPEVEGTMGRFEGRARDGAGGRIQLVEKPADVETLVVRDPQRVAFVTQTTLSMDDTARVIDALRARFPAIVGPRKDDICYATQNRQDAVKRLASRVQVLLVVGSRNSSNSNRLVEIGRALGARSFLIDGPGEVDGAWLEGVSAVGVTAGASAPEVLVQAVVARLRELGGRPATEAEGKPEQVVFALPKALRK